MATKKKGKTLVEVLARQERTFTAQVMRRLGYKRPPENTCDQCQFCECKESMIDRDFYDVCVYPAKNIPQLGIKEFRLKDRRGTCKYWEQKERSSVRKELKSKIFC